jgi:hypothetical protein
VAERELRHALARARAAGPQAASPSAITESIAVSRVAHAFTAVGVFDDAATVDAIQEDLALALRFRLHQYRPVPYAVSWAARRRTAWTYPAGQRPGPVPQLVIATPLRLPIPDGSLRILSYARTGSGGQLTVVARLRRRVLSGGTHPLDQLTATSDNGTRYRLRFDGSGGPDEWDGPLVLVPSPPPSLRWLEIAGPGTPAHRIELTAARDPDHVVTPASLSTGEQWLHTTAASLLADIPEFPPEVRRKMAAVGLGFSVHAATCLGDIVAGLASAGVLPQDSPLPGQLAVLCESLGIDDHGVRHQRLPAELPEPWQSLLVHYLRRTHDARPPDGCAGIALTMPEVDGIVFAMLGLQNTNGTTVLHMHASGLPLRSAAGLLPVIWLRDSAGRWHVTKASFGSEISGEATVRLAVVPPLTSAIWIEVVASGRTAEARATVPLHWE